MPRNRDEVIASITEFYTFLTTHLYFDPSELKTPPPAGWPKIASHRSEDQRKSDTVVDLLHHLPYLPGGNGQEKWIHDCTICTDYTNLTIEQGFELSNPSVVKNCPWEKLHDSSRTEHIVSLGEPYSDVGSFIYLDTLDGEVAVWDVEEGQYWGFDSAGEFYTWLREKYEKLEIFPVLGTTGGPDKVIPLTNDNHQGYKDFVKSLGWPLLDGSGWKRDEAMKELQRVYPKYR